MTAALAAEEAGAASSSGAGASASGGAKGGADPTGVNSAPGNPLNAPGSARRRKAKRAQRAADPRQSAPGSKAAQQRQAVEDLKASRQPEETDDHEDQDDDGDTGGRFAPFAGMQAPATGGGFVLGLIGWALVRAYIGNPGQPSGAAGVRRLLAAKFLNKTS